MEDDEFDESHEEGGRRGALDLNLSSDLSDAESSGHGDDEDDDDDDDDDDDSATEIEGSEGEGAAEEGNLVGN